MRKLLFLIASVLSIISIHAQSQNSQIEVQALVHRVDSLEHELSYLKLTHELYTLNSDITMFSNGVSTKTIAIQLDLYNRNFNSELGNSYQQYYESCLYRKQSISDLIEVRKKFFALKVITYPYTESEMETLLAYYNAIDAAYNTLEHSMNLLKITVDAYKKLM